MPRERWFYVKDVRRMGPLPKRQLVESLLALPDPRDCLIWRHGLPAWTPAHEVPEIDRQLAPFVKAAPAPAPSLGVGAESAAERTLRAPARRLVPPSPEAARALQPNIALYLGGLAAVLVLVVAGWLFWPRANGMSNGGMGAAPDGSAVKGGEAPAASPGALETPSTGKGAGARAPSFAGWSDQEAELPSLELRRLRGVGGWSGDKLTITIYNGSTWRVTQILVRTSRLKGEEFEDSETPHWLLPVGGAPVDAGVAELLKKVAPDRKKAGVNPLDAGPFEATVGPQPVAYRWKIEGARGYSPRS